MDDGQTRENSWRSGDRILPESQLDAVHLKQSKSLIVYSTPKGLLNSSGAKAYELAETPGEHVAYV